MDSISYVYMKHLYRYERAFFDTLSVMSYKIVPYTEQ